MRVCMVIYLSSSSGTVTVSGPNTMVLSLSSLVRAGLVSLDLSSGLTIMHPYITTYTLYHKPVQALISLIGTTLPSFAAF